VLLIGPDNEKETQLVTVAADEIHAAIDTALSAWDKHYYVAISARREPTDVHFREAK